MTDTKEAQQYYGRLLGCCLDLADIATINGATKVHYFMESDPDGDSGAAVFEHADGSVFVVEEWQDYSGHGCQCGADVTGPYPNLDAAIRFGLTKTARRTLGVSLPEDVNN